MTSFKFIYRFFFAFLLCTLFYNVVNAQRLFYDLKKDKVWLDSLNRLTKKFELRENFNYLQELNYFNACIALGEYYERLFHKKVIKSNKIAVHYYEKVSDFGTFPDDPHYYKAAALRNNVDRKLAAIFFTGDGIKRNWNHSLGLALRGSSGFTGFFEYYSQKYFHCICILLPSKKTIDFDTSNYFSVDVNPFALQSHVFSFKLLDSQLTKIGKSLKKRCDSDTSLNVFVVGYPAASMRSQARCNQMVENVKMFMIHKINLPPDIIWTNCDVGGGDPRTVDIYVRRNN